MVLVIGLALWLWGRPLADLLSSTERLQAWVAGYGALGPLITVGLNVLQVLIAVVPGQFVGMANGYLYGVWTGTLYSMVGLCLGSGLAMGLARRFGRPLVERLVDPEQLARWDEMAADRGPVFFCLVFLLPFAPDDLVCYVIGLTPLPLPRMLILTTLARLPGVLVTSWLGARTTDLPWWAWIPLGAGAAGLAWAWWRFQEPLERAVAGLIRRLTR
jgi:uncharacterized membrane protein YdjX (TVP38/TMEM64 family)